jgi:hypothetical protein
LGAREASDAVSQPKAGCGGRSEDGGEEHPDEAEDADEAGGVAGVAGVEV